MEDYAKEMVLNIRQIDIDIEQLENRIKFLGIEKQDLKIKTVEYSDNVEFTTVQIKEIFNLKQTTEQNYIALKESISEYSKSLSAKGQFANPLWEKTDRDLKEIINSMTEEEKASQFFIYAIGGASMNASLKTELEKNKPSGVIYMGYNIANISTTKKFSNDIQLTNTKIPLFISTDQEGGVVKRVPWDTTASEKEWANLSDEKICEQGKTRANTLHDIGINLNFAPVVDLSLLSGGFINNRTISNDPSVVIDRAKEFIDCSQQNDVFTTLKHYPGHGSTSDDSHFKLPIIDKSKDEWLNSDAKPFKELMDSKFIMVGHLLFKQIDSENPATLSKTLITDILKNEFQYKGLIVTDDMNMLYTSTKIPPKDMIVKSINAGVDQLLFVGFPKTKEDLIKITSNAIKSKEIEPERVQESLFNILKTKRDLK